MNNPGSGFENSFSTMVASQANRYKFITEVMAFCDKYGFDG
jgi:GH18 family chitinase